MVVAYRTVQYPQMEDPTASAAAKDHQIGDRFHVTYLNAAGRQVRAGFSPPTHPHARHMHKPSVPTALPIYLTPHVFESSCA